MFLPGAPWFVGKVCFQGRRNDKPQARFLQDLDQEIVRYTNFLFMGTLVRLGIKNLVMRFLGNWSSTSATTRLLSSLWGPQTIGFSVLKKVSCKGFGPDGGSSSACGVAAASQQPARNHRKRWKTESLNRQVHCPKPWPPNPSSCQHLSTSQTSAHKLYMSKRFWVEAPENLWRPLRPVPKP